MLTRIFVYSLYDKCYSSPMTVWYQKCKGTVTQIKWCQLYFDEGNEPEKAKEEKKGP
jgi:hypothetical protein